jgi:hypothetical protein
MDILLGIPDGDVTRDSFSQIKSFARQFTKGLKLGNNDIRMGVFSYGDSGKTVTEIRNGISSSTIETAIQSLSHGGGGNRKGEAILHASRMFGLSPRSGVSKSVVLLTNGRSTGSSDLSTIKESYPEMDIYPVAVESSARADGAKLSAEYSYYDSFSDLVSSGPFEITSKVFAAGSSTGTTVNGNFKILFNLVPIAI